MSAISNIVYNVLNHLGYTTAYPQYCSNRIGAIYIRPQLHQHSLHITKESSSRFATGFLWCCPPEKNLNIIILNVRHFIGVWVFLNQHCFGNNSCLLPMYSIIISSCRTTLFWVIGPERRRLLLETKNLKQGCGLKNYLRTPWYNSSWTHLWLCYYLFCKR